MRDICEILGVNRGSFYYQPKEDPSEAVLLAEIEKLAGAYPRYGYRRIRRLLLRQGHIVGTRRVARLMKENDLLVSIKRAGQTTQSLQGEKPWSNLLENLEVSHQDQVWVADITYIRLKGRFIYLCLLMDVFTRVIKAWQLGPHLSQSLTLKPLEEAFCHSVPEIHHSDQGVQYLSKAYVSTLKAHGVEISGVSLADGLGRTDMLNVSSAPSKRKKLTSMTIRTSPRREIASDILSHRCITINAHIRR